MGSAGCHRQLPKHWETTPLSPGRLPAESREQKPRRGLGRGRTEKISGPCQVPRVVSVRGREQSHLLGHPWEKQSSRETHRGTRKVVNSFTHSLLPTGLLQACRWPGSPGRQRDPCRKGEATIWVGSYWVRRAVHGPWVQKQGQDILLQGSPQSPGWPSGYRH